MSWQRFNQTTNVFEVSEDNGASWTTLVIAAAGIGLGANIAYTNVSNVFTEGQSIITPTYPTLNIRDASGVADSKQWRIFVHSGADQALFIDCLNDAGSGIVATPLVLERNGDAHVQRDMFASRDGTFDRTVSARINLFTGQFVYPGRADVGGGAYQSTWYLASHASTGLFSNSGFYSQGDISALGGYFERARTSRLGEWLNYTPVFSVLTGTASISALYGCRYTLIGKTCIVAFYAGINLSTTGNNAVTMTLPAGITAQATWYMGSTFASSVVPNGVIAVVPGTTYLSLYCDTGGAGLFPAGGQVIAGQVAFEIA